MAVVGGVLDLLGEKITAVNNARDVLDFYNACLVIFADTVFMEVDVLGSFEGD